MTAKNWVKYPRTYHHHSSPGLQSDDKVAPDLSALEGNEVVITEKMDGENTTLYADGYHARSLDSGYHPSRSWLAGFHAQISHLIPNGWRICGENLYARHSVCYDTLPSYFLAFSVWDDANFCLPFDETAEFLSERGVEMAPVLARGTFSEGLISQTVQKLNTDDQEGFVIRPAAGFQFDAFSRSVIKWVRAGHVQSETHWRSGPMIINAVAEGSAS